MTSSNNTTAALPKARSEGLIVRQLGDELLVYDTRRDHASALNPFAARVWRACDGESDLRAIAQRLSDEGGHVEAEAVSNALALLSKAGLLETAEAGPLTVSAGRSRRQALLAVAAGAATIAVVTTIAAPTPARAASCLPFGAACGAGICCAPNFCLAGTCQPGT